MCLLRVDNHHTSDEGEGWKIYLRDKDRDLISACVKDKVVENVWMKAESKSHLSYINSSDKYDRGFHILESIDTLKKADKLCGTAGVFRKVKYRKVICSGWQIMDIRNIWGRVLFAQNVPTIVADEIMVIDEITAPPIKTRNTKLKEVANAKS